MKALAALQGKYEWFTLSTGGQFTPNPLTKEQWLATAFGPPGNEDAMSDLLCEIVNWTVKHARVDAILANVPADYEWSSDTGDNPTKATLAWWYLWDQLTEWTEEAK
jgi:hypothetical protein